MAKPSALLLEPQFKRLRSDFMRHSAAIFCIVIIILTVPNSVAQESDSGPLDLEFQWSYDLGDVFVSTKPLIYNDTVYVRTSTSNPNSDSAGVFAFNLGGEPIWKIENNNSTFHDMSPLLFVQSGQGDCGSWGDLLVIGWSDGTVEALNPNTGQSYWRQNTVKIAWGITGSMLIDEDNLIVPTRNGLAGFCLADGSNTFDYETGLGWRNGVSKLGDMYYLGDENGNLWSVSNSGFVQSVNLEIGKIRHAPLILGDKLLLHGQDVSSSNIVLVNTSDFSVELISSSGPSPGIPLLIGQTVVLSDLENIGLLRCTLQCTMLDQHPFTSNGELATVQDGKVMLPRNTADGGWGVFSIKNNSTLEYQGLFSTPNDWYGTSAPGFSVDSGAEILVLANDNGILEFFSKHSLAVIELDDKPSSNYYSQILTLILMIFTAIVGVQYLREKYSSAFRFLTLTTFLIFLASFNDIVTSWSQYVDNSHNQSEDQESLWQDDWPSEWLGTQIIVFEFENQTMAYGGITGESTALSLTVKVVEENQMSVEISDTPMGKYIESFNQQQGDGWIYFVDGYEAVISAEFAEISSDSIIHWKMV